MNRIYRYLLLIINKVISKFSSIYWKVIIYNNFRNNYDISKDFKFNGKGIKFYGKGKIVIGDSSYIGALSTIQASLGYEVRIGKGCQISHNVRMYTQTAIADADFSKKPPPSKYGNIIIGDNCWIGVNVFINPGITIGDNSVVGANSVVTKNIPSNEIWGGVPAKLIREKQR